MTEPSNSARFEQIVEWAYSTLPEKIKNLPDSWHSGSRRTTRDDAREDVEETELASEH
jgi:hypothetical protein